MKDFNKHTTNWGKATMKAFPGATTKRLNHYIVPSLEEERQDAAIVHVGIKNLLHKGKFDEVEKLAEEIIEIGLRCRNYNLNDVLISGIIYSSNADIGMIRRLNKKLNSLCKLFNFIFIDNDNNNKMHI